MSESTQRVTTSTQMSASTQKVVYDVSEEILDIHKKMYTSYCFVFYWFSHLCASLSRIMGENRASFQNAYEQRADPESASTYVACIYASIKTTETIFMTIMKSLSGRLIDANTRLAFRKFYSHEQLNEYWHSFVNQCPRDEEFDSFYKSKWEDFFNELKCDPLANVESEIKHAEKKFRTIESQCLGVMDYMDTMLSFLQGKYCEYNTDFIEKNNGNVSFNRSIKILNRVAECYMSQFTCNRIVSLESLKFGFEFKFGFTLKENTVMACDDMIDFLEKNCNTDRSILGNDPVSMRIVPLKLETSQRVIELLSTNVAKIIGVGFVVFAYCTYRRKH